MPIIRIDALVSEPIDVAALLHRTGHAAANALSVPFEHCCVRFHEIHTGYYLARGQVRNSAEATEVSPLVEIVLSYGARHDTLARLMHDVAIAVAEELHVPTEIVFIECRVANAGHIHSGGRVY